jgi:CDP-6-deoxy-D-xylo-4-hexulose-3-dehydrase
MSAESELLRSQILDLVARYYAAAFAPEEFLPGQTAVPVSGRAFDQTELQRLVDSALDFWLTTGRFADQFERKFAQAMGLRHAMLCNSGSSANLLALTCLTAAELKDRRLMPGDEVITVAAGFPTTIAPIVQNRLIPVFVDVTVPTYNVDTSLLQAALSERTRAVILAHTLGNPFEAEAVADFCRKHDLWLIEDCCDAVGSTYRGKKVGTFGDLATVSFYPAHHITMGEGGCVLTDRPLLKKLVESYRDWGRDCWCAPGKADTCGRRYEWKLGDLPDGYDHKYVYSRLGYNLKLTDMQAAVGVAQLDKLTEFVESRRRNFRVLDEGLRGLEEFLVLPEATPDSQPSWFGFPLAVRPTSPFSRNDLVRHLDRRRIGTRLLFAGNAIRQPAFQDVQYRVAGGLCNTDFAMNHVFWLGVFPGLTPAMLSYVIDAVHEGVEVLR